MPLCYEKLRRIPIQKGHELLCTFKTLYTITFYNIFHIWTEYIIHINFKIFRERNQYAISHKRYRRYYDSILNCSCVVFSEQSSFFNYICYYYFNILATRNTALEKVTESQVTRIFNILKITVMVA